MSSGLVILVLVLGLVAVTAGVLWFVGRPRDTDPPFHHRDPGTKQTHGT